MINWSNSEKQKNLCSIIRSSTTSMLNCILHKLPKIICCAGSLRMISTEQADLEGHGGQYALSRYTGKLTYKNQYCRF